MKITITREGRVPVTSGTIGLFFEDLNYDLDGGLYAEMLENRNFEAKDVHGEWDHYIVEEDGGYGWTPYPGQGDAELKICSDRPLTEENPHYLRLTVRREHGGVKNKAYDGIFLTKGMKYSVSLWARSYDYKGKAAVGIYCKDKPLFEKKLSLKPDGKWRKFSFSFKSKVTEDGADFAFRLAAPGSVHLDCFSMMPDNAVKGLFRRDLAELMKDLKPGFLRFPGGCVVEGNGLANRYLWQETLREPERRPHNWNRWAVHATGPHNNFRSEYSHYGQTLGIGYYEYFLLCEYLSCKPLPVVSVGIACQYMSTEFVPVDDPELEVYIREALDVIEFANGGMDTKWGKVRAEMGHPKPFGLEYLGVGNEQWEASPVQKDTGKPASNEFYRRFELFEKRIHEKYPDIKIVGTAGPNICSETHTGAWNWMEEKLKENPDFIYCADEHFYVTPEWMYEHMDLYDNYPRSRKVYAGEYAAHVPHSGAAFAEGGRFNAPEANCWESALAEAAFMTGMERNADVVVMSSYAPLFARIGYAQWCPDMIWFNGRTAYATANYYVQQIYSLYTGNFALKTSVDREKIYATASEREGLTYVKIVNTSDEEAEAEIGGDYDFGALTRILCMDGELKDYNSLEEPEKIVPYEIAPTAERSLTLPPRSFCVLTFRK